MEDMARLAVLEQNVGDTENYTKSLVKLLEHIGYILDNPDDVELRTIKSDFLKKFLAVQGFTDYLSYIGFKINGSDITYPKELSLNQLRLAQAALNRKLHFSCGVSQPLVDNNGPSHSQTHLKQPKLMPVNCLRSKVDYIQRLQSLFNDMLKYEDEDLQKAARDCIPLVMLQLRALDRMREHQRKLKEGEITGQDMNFDIALLMELVGWFKYSFFTWVDKPPCELCGGATVYHEPSTMVTETETCRVEVYKCLSCGGATRFPRHNDPRTLLRARRGRCGEWANCFVLLCRSLGYDTRYVMDLTDHVWCEVFDYDSNRWLHVDPCEAKLDAPLIYEHGWGKKLTYVAAFSRDDLQDVTWRYTSDHKAVLRRRNLCSEPELIHALLALREARQRPLSEARRRYLAKRTLQELAQLMVEKKPTDYENTGRMSGSIQWRSERGEIGTSHTFEFTNPGTYRVLYFTSPDKYLVYRGDKVVQELERWDSGAFERKNLLRKEEADWRMVYLAREEGSASGSVSWRVSANSPQLQLLSLAIRANTSLYENGEVDWTIVFDGEKPKAIALGESTQEFEEKRFKEATLTATLSGGLGDVAWQHAQLFRQSLDAKNCSFEISLRAEKTEEK